MLQFLFYWQMFDQNDFYLLWQDLMLRHGWRTAAIVPELEHETKVVSTDQYALNLTWLQALTGLMERLQVRMNLFLLSRTYTLTHLKKKSQS